MRTKFYSTILHMSILAAIILPLGTSQSEEECEVVIKVRSNVNYSAVVGGTLRIFCPVIFCSGSTPTISWVKFEEEYVPVNVSPGSRFTSEWETLQRSMGVNVLIIQKVERNDSGLYRCQSEQGTSHSIKVFVNDDSGTRTITEKNDINTTATSRETPTPLWPNVYCVVGIMGLVFLVVAVYVSSDSLRKGLCCGGRSEEQLDQKDQPSHDALQMDVIHESAQ